MKGGGDGGRAPGVGEISLADDINVLGSSKDGHRLDSEDQTVAFFLRSGQVEVEQVLIFGVVSGGEKADDPSGVAGGPGNEVRNGRRGRVGGRYGSGREERRVRSAGGGGGIVRESSGVREGENEEDGEE